MKDFEIATVKGGALTLLLGLPNAGSKVGLLKGSTGIAMMIATAAVGSGNQVVH